MAIHQCRLITMHSLYWRKWYWIFNIDIHQTACGAIASVSKQQRTLHVHAAISWCWHESYVYHCSSSHAQRREWIANYFDNGWRVFARINLALILLSTSRVKNSSVFSESKTEKECKTRTYIAIVLLLTLRNKFTKNCRPIYNILSLFVSAAEQVLSTNIS